MVGPDEELQTNETIPMPKDYVNTIRKLHCIHSSDHTKKYHTLTTSLAVIHVCDKCHDSIMLMLASKGAMDSFYRQMLPLVEQQKIRKERAALYARSEVVVEG